MPERLFRFKQFAVNHHQSLMKVGTDGILLGAWTPVTPNVTRILDIGTGCGLIALMLAQRTNSTSIDGVEPHPPSCEEAQSNFRNSPWSDRLNVVHCSIQDFVEQRTSSYDLIVSNPPFFNAGESRNSARHTNSLTHADLIAAIDKLLTEKGRFCLIIPQTERDQLLSLALAFGFYLTLEVEVFTKPNKPVERSMLQFQKSASTYSKKQLFIYNNQGTYTSDYKELVNDFYL